MSDAQETLRLIERVSRHLSAALGGPSEPSGRQGLYRSAWAGVEAALLLSDIAALAAALPANIETDLTGLPSTAIFEPPAARILLNVLLLAAESLPNGGAISLVGTAADIFIQIAGPNASWPPGLPLCLVNEAEALAALSDGRNLQMAFTALLARASGIRLSSLLSPGAGNQPAILHFG